VIPGEDVDSTIVPFFPGEYTCNPPPDDESANIRPPHRRSMPERIYILFEDASESVLGKYLSIIIMLLIILSVMLFIVESLPTMKRFSDTCKDCGPLSGDDLLNDTLVAWRASLKEVCTSECQAKPLKIFFDLETLCVSVFTIEYVARFLTAWSVRTSHEIDTGKDYNYLRRTWKFVFRPLNCVDLLSVVPFYLSLVASDSGSALAVLRIIRLMRIFRLFRMNEYSDAISMFTNVMVKSSLALYLLFFFMSLGMIIFGSLLFYVEEGSWEPSTGRYMRPTLDGYGVTETPFVSIPHTFWWVIVTMTTVGNGDVSPTTPLGQLIGVLTMLTGILCLALPITVIGANFAGEYEQQQTKNQKNEELQEHVRYLMKNFCDMAMHKELRSAWSIWRGFVNKHRIESGDDAAAVVHQLQSCLEQLEFLSDACRQALANADLMMRERQEYRRMRQNPSTKNGILVKKR